MLIWNNLTMWSNTRHWNVRPWSVYCKPIASSGPPNVVRCDFFSRFRQWIISVCSRQSLSLTSKLISFNTFKSNTVWPAKQTDNERQQNRAHYLYYLVPCNLSLSVSKQWADHMLCVKGFVHAKTEIHCFKSVCCYLSSGTWKEEFFWIFT